MEQDRVTHVGAPAASAEPPASDGLEGWFLTTAGSTATLVLPRRMRLHLVPGTGRLLLPPQPNLDAEWRVSVEEAWREAHRLAGSPSKDACLTLLAHNSLTGASAGLSVGLLCLSALLERPLPAHVATGGVVSGGYVVGGLAARGKAEFAAAHAEALGLVGAQFLCPPVEMPPAIGPLRIAIVTDLAGAFRRLHPGWADAAFAALHDGQRRSAAVPWSRLLDIGRPFAILASASHTQSSLTEEQGIQVARVPVLPGRAGEWLLVGDAGRLIWKTPWAGGPSCALMAQRGLRAGRD